MPLGTFFCYPLSTGITTAQTGRNQAFAVFNAGGEQIMWFGPLPTPGSDEAYPWVDEALLLMGIDKLGFDMRRIAEIPNLKQQVKLSVQARKDGQPGYQVYINDPKAAPNLKQAAADDVAKLADAFKARMQQRQAGGSGPDPFARNQGQPPATGQGQGSGQGNGGAGTDI